MSYFIYARKSRKDAELEALGIDVLERHITTLLEYVGWRPRNGRRSSGQR